ncbi:MAG: glycerol kinase GlpK [Lachnospiraceae bacterium]|nr:glycerol kinase GlpK [Lachnospiraceae bacterium]
MEEYILAIDQGTTSTRAVVFDRQGKVRAMSQREVSLNYPKPGWVEADAAEIWISVVYTMIDLVRNQQIDPKAICGIGITNQRETTVIWDKRTGVPIYPAIVWQSVQTADICQELRTEGAEELILKKTGLKLNPYFSASKIRWILDTQEGAREKAERGDLLFGTIDSWLVYRMTNQLHVTDYSNASRTMLFNIHTLSWDPELLRMFRIPETMLPEVKNSSEIYGMTAPYHFFGLEVPVAGIAGDQQAALFGHRCFAKGKAKNTYGTGCFLLMNAGDTPIISEQGLVTTIGWGLDGKITYALEGSIFSAGSAIQWLRDGLQIIDSVGESEELAESVEDSGGVYMVPAFTGMGAPYWEDKMKCTLLGITRGSNKAHIARAALESIAYQTREVMEAMHKDSQMKLSSLAVDGGASKNQLLMQFQSDILGKKVIRSECVEMTALGAAFLAGLAVGFWENTKELETLKIPESSFFPTLPEEEKESKFAKWKMAVQAARVFQGE